ncbi:response regulator [Dyadobacter psychrotolerans]|uniref:Response regulator n=1 Tax=Dyadobacter psychrotolerans TaxID=2541721 RepID=A0A4R5DU74_9BACT|nr:response regulator [Dyadobacter psychrotolerans]
MRKAIEVINVNIQVVEASDGSDLLDLVEVEAGHFFEVVVILDMNVPKVTGLEALAAIRSSDRIKHIPAVMLSTSADPQLIKTDIVGTIGIRLTCSISLSTSFSV